MKKFISFLLAALLVFSFTSCGKEKEDFTDQTDEVITEHKQELTDGYDLSIKNVRFNNSTIRAGYPAEFKVTLENHGGVSINDFNIVLYDEFNNELYVTSYKNETIRSGDTKEIQIATVLPTDFTPRDGYFKVTLNKYSDINDANNTFKVRLSYEDIAIENVDVVKGKNNNIEISGIIVNKGYGVPSKIIVELRKDNEYGDIIDTIVIENSLKMHDFAPFSFNLKDDNYTRYCVMLSEDSITGGNMNILNDLAYTYSK